MTGIRKVLNVTSLLFGLVTLYCFLGWKLGYDGLFLIGSITVPLWIEYFCGTICYLLNWTFIIGFALQLYTKELFKVMLLFLPLVAVTELLPPNMLFSSLVPLLYIMLWAILKRDFKKSTIRMLVISAIYMVYQIVALLIKVGKFELGYNILPMYQNLVMAIDAELLLLIIYARGGEKFYAQVVDRRSNLECVLFPEDIETPKHDSEDLVAQEALAKLEGFKKLKACLLLLGFQLVQWTIILFICSLGNVFIEGLVITTSFIAHGFIIRRRWHDPRLTICTLAGAVGFYAFAKLTISFYYSQLFSVVLGLALVYALYRISVLLDRQQMHCTAEKLERLKKLEKAMQVAWTYIDKMDTD